MPRADATPFVGRNSLKRGEGIARIHGALTGNAA